MLEIEHPADQNMIVIRASGKLTANDYETAVPEIEHAIELSKGPLRVLLRLEDFSGWEIDALWHEIQFDLKFRKDWGRIAVIGETAIESWATTLSAPFTRADMRFFSNDQEAEAYEWLKGTPPTQVST